MQRPVSDGAGVPRGALSAGLVDTVLGSDGREVLGLASSFGAATGCFAGAADEAVGETACSTLRAAEGCEPLCVAAAKATPPLTATATTPPTNALASMGL